MQYRLPIVNSKKFTIVSKEDFKEFNKTRLYFTRGGYVCFLNKGKMTRFSRFILSKKLNREVKKEMHCDHINRDILDNRRENLREVTPKENRANQSDNSGENNPMYGISGKLHVRSKPVKCIETGVIYDSGNLAALDIGCSRGDIYAVCNGRQKTVKGFTFIKV